MVEISCRVSGNVTNIGWLGVGIDGTMMIQNFPVNFIINRPQKRLQNFIMTTKSTSRVNRYFKQNHSVLLPPSMKDYLLNPEIPQEMIPHVQTITIGLLIPIVSSPKTKNISEIPLFSIFLPSMLQTIHTVVDTRSQWFRYIIFLGTDHGDPVYDDPKKLQLYSRKQLKTFKFN